MAYASVDFPDPLGPMTACTSPEAIFRSTPLTISVPSSSATCRFFSSRIAMLRDSRELVDERLLASVRDFHRSQAAAGGIPGFDLRQNAATLSSYERLDQPHPHRSHPPDRATPLRGQAPARDRAVAGHGHA